MRNCDGRASGDNAYEIMLDRPLPFRSERAGCFVENKNRTIVINSTRNRYALLLSTRDRETRFTDFRLITHGQTHDEIMCGGGLSRSENTIQIRFRIAERNVACDRLVEHVVFLQHHS